MRSCVGWGLIGLMLAAPAAAQEGQTLCNAMAPKMRAAAVDARQTLSATRDILPEGVRLDASKGIVDAEAIRSGIAPDLPPGFPHEVMESIVAAAYLLPILQQATESYEIAASALEACAKQPSE